MLYALGLLVLVVGAIFWALSAATNYKDDPRPVPHSINASSSYWYFVRIGKLNAWAAALTALGVLLTADWQRVFDLFR